jgi:pilus assembly protein CpaE
MADALEPIMEPSFASSTVTRLRNYPSPKDLSGAVSGATPTLVLLDAVSDQNHALELMAEITRLGPHAQIIALLNGNDPDSILRCLRAGSVDFLIQPFTPDQLEAALAKLNRVQPTALAHKETAKIFAVMPAKGACGATTVACNLAYQWKRLGAKRILLADLDTLTGNLSFLLKIKSTYNFVDALTRSHELDNDLWHAMVTNVGGVDVLLAPELVVDAGQDIHDPSPVIDFARTAYDVVVLDCSGVYGDWNLHIARAATELLLVTTNELPALQAAQRAISYLDTNRIGRWKLKLVVNRYLRDVGLSREVIGTALHTEVFETLPSDYEAVQKALMDGKPIPSSTLFGKGIAQLADKFAGDGPPKSQPGKKSSSLSGLLNLFSRTSK